MCGRTASPGAAAAGASVRRSRPARAVRSPASPRSRRRRSEGRRREQSQLLQRQRRLQLLRGPGGGLSHCLSRPGGDDDAAAASSCIIRGGEKTRRARARRTLYDEDPGYRRCTDRRGGPTYGRWSLATADGRAHAQKRAGRSTCGNVRSNSIALRAAHRPTAVRRTISAFG